MTSLEKSDVKRLAKLADLELSESEIKELTPQLSEVINFFDELKEVNTDSVEPTSQTTGLTDVLRKDEIDSTRILKLENNYFEVKALLDKSKNKS